MNPKARDVRYRCWLCPFNRSSKYEITRHFNVEKAHPQNEYQLSKVVAYNSARTNPDLTSAMHRRLPTQATIVGRAVDLTSPSPEPVPLKPTCRKLAFPLTRASSSPLPSIEGAEQDGAPVEDLYQHVKRVTAQVDNACDGGHRETGQNSDLCWQALEDEELGQQSLQPDDDNEAARSRRRVLVPRSQHQSGLRRRNRHQDNPIADSGEHSSSTQHESDSHTYIEDPLDARTTPNLGVTSETNHNPLHDHDGKGTGTVNSTERTAAQTIEKQNAQIVELKKQNKVLVMTSQLQRVQTAKLEQAVAVRDTLIADLLEKIRCLDRERRCEGHGGGRGGVSGLGLGMEKRVQFGEESDDWGGLCGSATIRG